MWANRITGVLIRGRQQRQTCRICENASGVGRWLAGEEEKRDLKILALQLEGPQVKEHGEPQKRKRQRNRLSRQSLQKRDS